MELHNLHYRTIRANEFPMGDSCDIYCYIKVIKASTNWADTKIHQQSGNKIPI
jgi:hypothetical protein